MIKVIESDYLEDKFINKKFTNNIKIEDKLRFTTENIYYFGNYNKDKLGLIKKKLINNKKYLIKSIENGIKFIITGNSFDIFNNSFKIKDLNIFTSYEGKKRNRKKLLVINDLKKGISSYNFRYKNLICIRNEENIKKVIGIN